MYICMHFANDWGFKVIMSPKRMAEKEDRTSPRSRIIQSQKSRIIYSCIPPAVTWTWGYTCMHITHVYMCIYSYMYAYYTCIHVYIFIYTPPQELKMRVHMLIKRNPPPPQKFPIYYVPSSRTVCTRSPLEEPGTTPSRGVLLHMVFDEGT